MDVRLVKEAENGEPLEAVWFWPLILQPLMDKRVQDVEVLIQERYVYASIQT